MNKDIIDNLLKSHNLRVRSFDKAKVKSLVESAKNNANFALTLKISDKSSTVIFREIYESIRQLGEARWWQLGYEPTGMGSHGLSLDILKEMDIKNNLKLNNLDRLKKIRHDANYKGDQVPPSQAQEIVDLWNYCAEDIISLINDK